MKFKFPTTLQVGDCTFEIKYDKKHSGGSFHYPDGKKKGKIVIGMREFESNPTRFLGVVIHELKEIIHVEQDTRYVRYNNSSDYVFCYGHAEHTDLCARLTELLTHFIE